MADYITHPLLQHDMVERRLYQEVMVASALEKGNTLVVAPTALGKTVVAALLIAHLLQSHPEKKILFLAPTKPLAVQHQTRLREFLRLHPDTINVLTGSVSPEERKHVWSESTIITATPQTIENDLLTGKLDLKEVQLIIFDEAHRAVKDYSYVFLAQKYQTIPSTEKNPKLILALTASPGSTEEEIQDVCKNLFISNVIVKRHEDEDVKPYINEINVEWRRMTLPPTFYEIKTLLEGFLKENILFFKKIGYAKNIHSHFIRRMDLLELQKQMRQDMTRYGNQRPQLYQGMSRSAAVLKISHAVILLETQGIQALNEYWEKMLHAQKQSGAPKALGLIFNHPNVQKALQLTQKLSEDEIEHPKIAELKQILIRQLKEHPDSRVLVFNHYRDSVTHVTKAINQIEGIRATRFIGQATKSEKDKGLTQKKQIEILEQFREGEFNVLVASSVAEEGLDIPSVDLVIFYEPVPSEIRLIQRRGRTGRKSAGRVIILMAEKTSDEGMYWASKKKEANMHATLAKLANHSTTVEGKEKQTSLLKYAQEQTDKLLIFADTREQASTVIRELSLYEDVKIITKQMDVGDFVIGNEMVIERKTTEDFLSSLMDGRLLGQLANMSEAYAHPLILLEGKPEDLFTLRNIHEHAIIGMLSSIALNYRIPILFTRDAKDSAKYIYLMAKREQQGKDRDIRLRIGRKGLSMPERQQYLVEGLPGVGPSLAKSLLQHFQSIRALSNAELDELKEVEKIGPKKAAGILNVLTAPFEPEKKDKKIIKESASEEEEEEMVEALEEEIPIQNETRASKDADDLSFD